MEKRIQRKRFFTILGSGVFGFFAFKNLPFGFLSKKEKGRKPAVTINPLAVKRESTGVNNG
ncbi:MAG TPA: hypothetical protein PK397_08235 [Ignavibacteriaceae bacterium]|jgi:hypothetical protein|nr:hypothetical protein [Ignavibacteriaceae bacterium]